MLVKRISIVIDEMLFDGTPRKEKGYRAYIEQHMPSGIAAADPCSAKTLVFKSPLYTKLDDLRAWIKEAVL